MIVWFGVVAMNLYPRRLL